MPTEQIAIQSLECLAEREKLHLAAMLRDGVVDHLNHLFSLDPTMRMKHEVEHTLLDYGRVKRGFQVGHCDRIVWFVQVLGLPIARCNTWKLPALTADDI